MLQPLPFTDKEGNAFLLASPEPLLVHLHHIDRDAARQIKTPESSSIHENRERYLLHSLNQAVHDVVYQTARTDLLGLAELGLLVKFKQGNAFVFHAVGNLAERFQHIG